MSTPAYVSAPQVQFLSQVLEEIADGHLLVPRFHRPIVWNDSQRLELVRSVAQGTPIGSILVWRTRQTVGAYDHLGPYRLKRRAAKGEFSSFVLDGHQRLATLFGALQPQRHMELVQTPDPGEPCWEILYDLEGEDFLLAEDAEKDTVSVSLRVFLDSVESLLFARSLSDRPHIEVQQLVSRLEDLAAAFQRYKIPVIPIVTDDLDQATRTFQRVNTRGAPISQTHMIQALTWSEDFDLNSWLEELRTERLASLGWQEIDEELILASYKATLGLDIVETDVDRIRHAFRERPQVLEEATDHLIAGIRFLADHCNIRSPKVLPYAALLPLLADGLRRFHESDEPRVDALKYWFWWQVYIGLGTGTSSSRVRRAAEAIRRIAGGEQTPRTIMRPVAELAPPPPRWDFRSARAKALALRLAERKDEIEGSDEARRDLSLRGAEVVQPLIPWSYARAQSDSMGDRLAALLRGPANRILASAEAVVGIREQLLDGGQGPRPLRRLRETHLVPRVMPENDYLLRHFLNRRLGKLRDWERAFAARSGILTGPAADAVLRSANRAEHEV